MAGKAFAVCALLALPAFAQFQSIVKSPAQASISGDLRFELFADTPSPLPHVVPGFANMTRVGQTASMGHRYFYDETAHLYFGYDLVVQPEQRLDTYRVSFYDLSIGPLDFPDISLDSADPAQWKRLPLPGLPATRTIEADDNLTIPVYADPATGAELVDNLRIAPTPGALRPYVADNPQSWALLRTAANRNGTTPVRQASTVAGTARGFSADDAEMRLQSGPVMLNGVTQPHIARGRVANGSLVWFYVPDRGRYVLSLTPRPKLGFVKAGEVRGGIIAFTLDKDRVMLQSPGMVAPGDAAYTLYVLHDPQWIPASPAQRAAVQIGSVSVGEIAALAQ